MSFSFLFTGKEIMGRAVTIAICGVQPRIGTTTQALQLVAYLQMMGYATAYVELANQGYIYQMRKLYRDITVKDGGVYYGRLPLYSDTTYLGGPECYDYLVKDYGTMNDPGFNQVSFMEQDIQIICGGVKPNEIFYMQDLLKKGEYKAAKFIFSFVPPDQKEGILSLMSHRANDTFFANYNPDPFAYDSIMNKTYRMIMGNYISGSILPVSSMRRKWYIHIPNPKKLGTGAVLTLIAIMVGTAFLLFAQVIR